MLKFDFTPYFDKVMDFKRIIIYVIIRKYTTLAA